MKTKRLSFLVIISLISLGNLFAQLYIDGEDAYVAFSGDLVDNNRTLSVAKQGSNVINPWITNYSRAGNKGVGYRINGATSGENKQRLEHPVNAHWKNPVNISNGASWYTGFSIMLSKDVWSTPNSWFVIHQVQQVKQSGQSGNYPFIALEFSGNKLGIISRSGKNGNTTNSPSPQVNRKDINTLQKGVWYDIIVGWKYRPYNADGWVSVWIKTADQSNYTEYKMSNIKVGYYDAPQQILQNKIGIYRDRVNADNKMYFDEVRFATYLDGAKTSGNSENAIPIGQVVSFKGNNNKYFSSENGNMAMRCNRETAQDWEKFKIVDAGNGLVAIQGNDGRYVSSENGTMDMRCDRTSIQDWEKFTWVDLGNNKVALKGNNNGFVSSENGYSAMTCNRYSFGDWEEFTWGGTLKSVTGISEKLKHFNVYPNPVTESILYVNSSSDLNELKLSISNLNGQLVFFESFKGADQYKIDLSDAQLSKGMYFVTIQNGIELETQKIIVE